MILYKKRVLRQKESLSQNIAVLIICSPDTNRELMYYHRAKFNPIHEKLHQTFGR